MVARSFGRYYLVVVERCIIFRIIFLALKVAYSQTLLQQAYRHDAIRASLQKEAVMRRDRRIVPKRPARSILKGGVIPVDRRSLQDREREREWEREIEERVRERVLL